MEAVLAPVLAAIGALVTWLTACTIEIERIEATSALETVRPLGGAAQMPEGGVPLVVEKPTRRHS